MKLESEDKDLDMDGLSKIQLMVPLQSVAIGCHHHICRSNTDGRDELLKFILNRLARFYVEFRVIMEGGRVTLLARVRMALRCLLRRWIARLRA